MDQIENEKMKLSNTVDFNVYGKYVTIILSDAKMLKNNSLSMTRRIIGTSITGLFLISSILLMISETIDIKNSYDLPTFATRMNPICFHFCGTSKWIHAIINVNEIMELIGQIQRCHLISLQLNESDKDNHYHHIKMMKCNKEMSIFAGAYMTLLVYGTIRWCSNPIFYDLYNDIYGVKDMNSSFFRHLPYPGVIPWQIDNIYKYIGTFGLQAFASLGSGIGHAVYEIMNVTLLACAYSHLEYLHGVLTDQRDNELILRGEMAAKKFKNKLRICIVHHREILEFLRKLGRTTSTPMFIICSQSTLALCLVSLEASTMKIDSSIESIMTASSLLEYWLGINIQLFLYCYFATKIQGLGLDVADAIYLCDWEQAVNSSLYEDKISRNEYQRTITDINQMIQFSLARAQKPIILNGGLFYILSLETYKALTGFSLSNALVLRQVSEE